MELRKTLSKNSGVIAQIIFAGVCVFLPMVVTLASNIKNKEGDWKGLLLSAILLIIGFIISVFVLHKLNNLSEEVVDDENEYKKQWELYARLNESQKKHQKKYFYIAILSIAYMLIFLPLATYYGRDAIIMSRWWWAIPSYISVFLIITIHCLVEIYAYKINYYSNDSIQLLWEEIEKLIKRLGLDKEKLEEELDKTGNKEKFVDMILEYGIGFQPKDYNEQTEETIKGILEKEISIIEQLEATLRERTKRKNKKKEKGQEKGE